VSDEQTIESETHRRGLAESEERLRLATEAADMFAWEIDLVASRLVWAPNSARVIGCDPSELSSDPAEGAFFALPEDRSQIQRDFDRARQSNGGNYTLNFRGRSGDAERTHWQVRGTFVRDAKGRITRAVGATQNVTQQMKAAAELQLVADRLATAEEAAGALIYDWDVVTNKVWRSDGLTRILGWSQEDLGDAIEGWVRLRHPDDEWRFANSVYHDYVQANDHFILEYRVKHVDGHYVWVLDSGRLFRDASGAVVRVAGATVDISARKKVEASFHKQSNLIDLSFEPIFVWHPDRGIVEWNRGAAQLYGYSREEVMGKVSSDLLKTSAPLVHGDVVKDLDIGKSWTGELEQRTKDGRLVIVECRQQAIDSDGERLILETHHDISQRKQSETENARMAAVVLASHDALFGITLEGVFETWNPAAERMFGYAAAEIIGKHVSILADSSKHGEQLDLMRRAQGHDTVGPYDAKRVRKDGTVVDVSVSLAPVKAPDGRVISLSVAVHDISDRKEWETRQRLMTRELAHRIKNSFAVLQGILRSTLRTARGPHEFAEAFSGRLHSLAAAQDVLTDNNWKGAELGDLARRQLAAYVSPEDDRIDITGPNVNLPAEYAAPIGLIFNELATNAIKYGSLSVPTGSIQLYWRVEGARSSSFKIFITWRERGGPSVASQGERGFGSTLIERSLGDAKVENFFDPEGLTCKIELTLKAVGRLRRKPVVKHPSN
jgi:PAS domain S-box-containing protein